MIKNKNKLISGKKQVYKKGTCKEKESRKDIFVCHMKKILIMEKIRYYLFLIISMFILSIYVALSADGIVPVIETSLVCFMLIGCLVIPLLFVIIHYIVNKDIRNGIWVSVAELYEIKEEYNRFWSIKECIKNYKHIVNNQEINDVSMNINVIEAAIERDNTFSILTPILITVFTAVFIENDRVILEPFIYLLIIALIFTFLIDLGFQLPKNAFIKKVVINIREELDIGNAKKR
ncbi:MAG: hypothetical protein J6B96_05110 [Agathobacter sp.]|nr:hypothetical protein [Agathobacter sp.]